MSREDWGLEDPVGKGIDHVRRIRDQIEAKVRHLLTERNPTPSLPRRRESISLSAISTPSAVSLLLAREYP